MSLIISYVGRNGCVMVGDKRRIGFLGDKEKREKLEEYLYAGAIKTDDELLKVAKEQGISLNILNDASKVREIQDVIVGEVMHKTPFETKRKRIYATTNGYIIIELVGSNIDKYEMGDSSIIVFGNKFTKAKANELIKKYWIKKTSLKNVSKVFKKVMSEISTITPSISKEYDLYTKDVKFDKKESQKLLRDTIVNDFKDLQKMRKGLKKQLDQTAKSIEMASKIVLEGEIGMVKSIEGEKLKILLKEGIQALDMEWKVIADSGNLIEMNTDDPSSVTIGDIAVIENENLCIKRTKSNLQCDVILCRKDK
ncbi:MAG: MJ0548 connectase family domain-containing protein [Methanobacterium sp.]